MLLRSLQHVYIKTPSHLCAHADTSARLYTQTGSSTCSYNGTFGPLDFPAEGCADIAGAFLFSALHWQVSAGCMAQAQKGVHLQERQGIARQQVGCKAGAGTYTRLTATPALPCCVSPRGMQHPALLDMGGGHLLVLLVAHQGARL